MSPLVPQPIEALLGRALAEHKARRSVFDLPQRSFWPGAPGFDLSVDLFGRRVATPLGPAAGPHTQLAQNLVIGWLAGARALELKTVQVQDRLEIPRPCIDAPDLGYNVEWSQELTLEESASQYATAWLLIHALAALGWSGSAAGNPEAVFEVSVGYDLAGIRSTPVARFLDAMGDAGGLLAALRQRLPGDLRASADVPVPTRVADTVTLSTFHGCPPEEIEQIVRHLFARHRMNVVVKCNPTLLGYEAVEELLRGRLGYDEIELDRAAFASDLGWDDARALFGRLEGAAQRAGLGFGVKLTNTLVVRNRRGVLEGERIYLSGPPLHPLAITLAARLAEATGGRIPLSFSGGVDADNFADTVACGFAPVTTCTDLLKPTGYRRLPRYLKALVAAMEARGARTVDEFVRRRAGLDTLHDAQLANLAMYAASVVENPAYQASRHRAVPARSGALTLLDCASCNNCVVVCPNDAFFSLPIAPVTIETCEVVGDGVVSAPALFVITREKQWAVFADLCNECGNCDTFCPESGGPQRVKPRFHGSRASFEAAGDTDGILLEPGGHALSARLAGVTYRVAWDDGGARFSDGVLEATLDAEHRVVATRALGNAEGHRLSLWPYHALRLLREAALREVTPLFGLRATPIRAGR